MKEKEPPKQQRIIDDSDMDEESCSLSDFNSDSEFEEALQYWWWITLICLSSLIL